MCDDRVLESHYQNIIPDQTLLHLQWCSGDAGDTLGNHRHSRLSNFTKLGLLLGLQPKQLPISGKTTTIDVETAANQFQGARWQAVTGFDGASEILLLILPVHLLWHLQMRFSKKAMIIAAFWVRLP
jgi:hypothetical protein